MEDKEQKFEGIYQKLYHKYYQKYENMRKESKRNLIITAICFAIAYFSLCASSDIIEYRMITIPIAILTGIVGLIFLSRGGKRRQAYEKSYKQEVITEFIHDVDINLNYVPIIENQFEVKEIYQNARFDSEEYNRFYYDDHIFGNIEGDVQVDIYDAFHEIEKHYQNGDKTKDIVFSRAIRSRKNEARQKPKCKSIR